MAIKQCLRVQHLDDKKRIANGGKKKIYRLIRAKLAHKSSSSAANLTTALTFNHL